MADSFDPKKRLYGKRNFVELLENITPKLYQNEDIAMSGQGLDITSKVINSNLYIAANMAEILPISAVAYSETSSMGTISGIAPFFIKQNNLTNITPYSFETKILNPLGKSLTNFSTSASFNDYLSGTLLPIIQNDDGCLIDNISSISALNSSIEPSSIHNYLADALGWFYFLNTSGGADHNRDWQPSSFVLSSYNGLYVGGELTTVDGIKGLTNLIFRNYALSASFADNKYIPTEYLSGTALYTSGFQSLDKLETILDVIYSPLYIDSQDFKVKDTLDDYIDAQTILNNKTSDGPMRKFFEAIGFGMADTMNQVDTLELIYDIENVPDEYLSYVAQLVGWKLFGNSTDKWRQQLRNAVEVYKRKGTLDSIQYVMNSLISNAVMDVSGSVQELWESYLPFLCWYALATESPNFSKFEHWSPAKAQRSGVFAYNPNNLQENIKLVVDSILLDLYRVFPENFIFFGDRFPVYRFVKVNDDGTPGDLYTLIYEPNPKPYHRHPRSSRQYRRFRRDAEQNGELCKWDAALSHGPYGPGVYMAGDGHPTDERPTYLSATGDPYFVYSYRGRENYPIPPFEEIKYYKDSSITANMLKFLIERLLCFGVKKPFADKLHDYVLSSVVTASSNLGSLNEWLFFDLSSQQAPNYYDVLRDINRYPYDVLGLWNGKSSHLFIDYKNEDFDFESVTLDGDSKTSLYEASRVIKRFVPAHAIPRINLSVSADDKYTVSASTFNYVGLDKTDAGFAGASGNPSSVMQGFESSGVLMTGPPGSHHGRNQFNTFKRDNVDTFDDRLISSSVVTTAAPRKAIRRRNYRFTLPEAGYYDRGGFNAPTDLNASCMEFGFDAAPASSGLGELTLGYLYSANAFYPVHDTGSLSGVWDQCEDLDSPRSFSGAYTSRTYPYRGLSSTPPIGVNQSRWTQFGNYRMNSGISGAGITNGRWELDGGANAKILYVGTRTDPGTWAGLGLVDNSVSANNIMSPFSPGNLRIGDGIVAIATANGTASKIGKKLRFAVTAQPTLGWNGYTTGGNAWRGWYWMIPITTIAEWGDEVALDSNTNAYVDLYGITQEKGTGRNQDRDQLPSVYATMHSVNEKMARAMAKDLVASDPDRYTASAYWWDAEQSLANSAIASGYIGDTFNVYRDFKFGRGLHKTFRDYCDYYQRHPLGANALDETGANIFSQVFGRGLYNSNFKIAGRFANTTTHNGYLGNFIASSLEDSVAIAGGPSGVFSTSAVYSEVVANGYASGTYIASALEEMVLPLSGTFTPGKPLNAEFRNAKILSGVEFVQTSGAPSSNEFRLFKLDESFAEIGQENFLINNTVIKQKSRSGLPRIRFDLSAYGPRVNHLVPEHIFSLDISAMVGEENTNRLGGESMGVWIHTNVTNGYMWSFVPNYSNYVKEGNRIVDGRWIWHKECDLSIREVTHNLCFKHNFPMNTRDIREDTAKCFGNVDVYGSVQVNNASLNDIRSQEITNVAIKFDTRNFSIYNNMEYLQVIPIPEEVYKLDDGVHAKKTNYYVEIFLLPTLDESKYLLIEDIKLQDLTQRENAAVGTNTGVETLGTPFRPFVKENKIELDKQELQGVLKFFTGLMGSGVGTYQTSLASRDKEATFQVMGREGGSRLNYRLHPSWNPLFAYQAAIAGSTPLNNQVKDIEVVN
tara:strand:- start:8198 stop:13150 length:4953 start_codon:yes stop_codon:yes gene_type:complete